MKMWLTSCDLWEHIELEGVTTNELKSIQFV